MTPAMKSRNARPVIMLRGSARVEWQARESGASSGRVGTSEWTAGKGLLGPGFTQMHPQRKAPLKAKIGPEWGTPQYVVNQFLSSLLGFLGFRSQACLTA